MRAEDPDIIVDDALDEAFHVTHTKTLVFLVPGRVRKDGRFTRDMRVPHTLGKEATEKLIAALQRHLEAIS